MPALPDPIAELRGVTRRFDAVVALEDVSIGFAAGSVHALLGENGSGKSTAVRVLTGALMPDEGAVVVDGRDVHFSSPRQAIAAGIAAAYQESALVPHLSVAENVLLGHETARLGVLASRGDRAASRWLDMVGLSVNPSIPIGTLSVAEQQLVAIAKALSMNARLLILDEPTAALNSVEVQHLLELVEALSRRGRLAIVYITHRLGEVAHVADTVTVLKDGRVVVTRPAAGLQEEEIVRLMVGRTVDHLFPERSEPGDKALLAGEGLRSGDGAVAVDRFTVRAGEIVGIAGLEGSGRATLARMLAGVEPRAQGRIDLGGRSLDHPSPGRAIRRGLGFVPPDRRRQGLVPTFSVGKSITLSSLPEIAAAGVLRPRRERLAATRFLERFGI